MYISILNIPSYEVPSWGGILMVNSNLNVCVKPINSAEDMQMEKAIVKEYSVVQISLDKLRTESQWGWGKFKVLKGHASSIFLGSEWGVIWKNGLDIYLFTLKKKSYY